MRNKSTTIDGYLATVNGETRSVLEKLRATIRKTIPTAEECISYGIPAFRVDGVVVAGFAATKTGYSYFPFSGSTLTSLAGDLEPYDGTKSALHCHSDKPLPTVLVRKLLRARLAEVKARGR